MDGPTDAPAREAAGDEAEEAPDWIRLNQADVTAAELTAVLTTLRSAQWSAGVTAARFEAQFGRYLGRGHAISVASGTAGLGIALRALGIGPGDEVIASAYGWHQIANAIVLAGAHPVFADIDYWAGTLAPDKVAQRIGPRTRAIVAGNTNGHPAPWQPLRELARRHGLVLIEDSTEAIGSTYQGRPVGSFGDLAIFDFSQASALACGDGAMIVTDDAALASEMRYLRSHSVSDRLSVSVGSRVPSQCAMSDLAAALGLVQLERLDAILARRKEVEARYARHIQSFEGIKPPYRAPEVDEVHWFTFLVHLGTRFTRSARNHIIDDLGTEHIEAAAYSHPLHLQFAYAALGCAKGQLPIAEKIADRGLSLPFHGDLGEEEVMFIVATAKDASINVGAGAAIY